MGKEAPVEDRDELLRLEYEYASRLLGTLTEYRFKLLALVPTLSGAVVALLSAGRSGVELLAIGCLGAVAPRRGALRRSKKRATGTTDGRGKGIAIGGTRGNSRTERWRGNGSWPSPRYRPPPAT